jgi:hypothetical protein
MLLGASFSTLPIVRLKGFQAERDLQEGENRQGSPDGSME